MCQRLKVDATMRFLKVGRGYRVDFQPMHDNANRSEVTNMAKLYCIKYTVKKVEVISGEGAMPPSTT